MILIERIKELASTIGEIIHQCCNKDDIVFLKREADLLCGNLKSKIKKIAIGLVVVLLFALIGAISQRDEVQRPISGMEGVNVPQRVTR